MVNNPQLTNYDNCIFYNFQWNEPLSACVIPGLDQSSCYCNTGNSSYPPCLLGKLFFNFFLIFDQFFFCIFKGYCSLGGTKSTCNFDNNTDTAYKYWDDKLNDCVINLNSYWVCVSYGFGKWVPGKKWVITDKSKYNVTTQQECESLQLCSVNNTLQNTGCDNDNCVGYNYTCVNSIFLLLLLFFFFINLLICIILFFSYYFNFIFIFYFKKFCRY